MSVKKVGIDILFKAMSFDICSKLQKGLSATMHLIDRYIFDISTPCGLLFIEGSSSQIV